MARHDGFEHHYATINGLRYHFVRQGSGPPLLLIHGWPGFYYEWHLNVKPLAQHFDVVVPDMRGYAYTDKPDLPPEEGYNEAVFAEDISSLCKHLGFAKVNIVSHDFGAIGVRRFARSYREMVNKLVFFDPPYPGIGRRWTEASHLHEIWYLSFHCLPWAEELIASSRRATEIYLRHFIAHWSYDKSLFTDEELAEYVEAYSQPGALRGGFNCYRALFRSRGPRSEDDDPKIYAPTLVLWGENDPILPVDWADGLGDFFPNLTLKRVPKCGHFVMREKPDLVNREITEFILGDSAGK